MSSSNQTPSVSPKGDIAAPEIKEPAVEPGRWKRWARKVKPYVIVLAVLLVFGVLYSLPMHLDRPREYVDYLALINAPARAVPESDHGWLAYRKAMIACDYADMNYRDFSAVYDKDGVIVDENWDVIEASLKRCEPLLEALRTASSKPIWGVMYSKEFSKEDMKALGLDKYNKPDEPVEDDIALIEGSLYASRENVHLGLRQLLMLLSYDIDFALHQGDMDRVMADLRSEFGMLGQISDPRQSTAALYRMMNLNMINNSVERLLIAHADQLSDEQLIELTDLFGQVDPDSFRDVKINHYIAMDAFQRIYGKSGKVTKAGMAYSFQHGIPLCVMFPGEYDIYGSLVELFTFGKEWENRFKTNFYFPRLRQLTMGYDAAMAEYTRVESLESSYALLPYWEQLKTLSPSKKQYKRVTDLKGKGFWYWPVKSYGTMNIRMTIHEGNASFACSEAMVVAIALERYRRAQGNYPETLASLVPTYLPARPVDHSTGKDLLYKLVDNKPFLYGRGIDGDDDNGDPGPNPDVNYLPSDEGDWHLYPRYQRPSPQP